MSDRRQPRSSELFGFYHQAHHFGGVKQEPLAHEMMNAYRAITPEDLQFVRSKTDSSMASRMAADQKRLSRYLDPKDQQLLPADLEEFMVEQFPEPYRTQAKTRLVRRYGSLYVPVPDRDASPDLARYSRVAKEFAEMTLAAAPIFEDLRIDESDLPYLRNAEDQADDLIAAVTAFKHQLVQIREAAEAKKAGKPRVKRGCSNQ